MKLSHAGTKIGQLKMPMKRCGWIFTHVAVQIRGNINHMGLHLLKYIIYLSVCLSVGVYVLTLATFSPTAGVIFMKLSFQ